LADELAASLTDTVEDEEVEELASVERCLRSEEIPVRPPIRMDEIESFA